MATSQSNDFLYETKKLIDKETGELVSGVFIPAELTHDYRITPKAKIDAYYKKKEATEGLIYFNKLAGDSFTFSLKESVRELFQNNDFSDAEKVHIIYLGSYVNYDGYLMTKNNQIMTKKLLREKVKIKNKDRFYQFYNKLLHLNFIDENEGKIYWNNNMCFKGSPKKNGTSSSKVFKTYDEMIQRLYKMHQPKSIAIIYRLIPYLNKYHNVICKYSDEMEYEKCVPYGISEVAELLGIKDYRNLKAKLRRIRLDDEYIFSFRQTGTGTTVIINPFLVWLSTYAPASNLIGDFSLAKAKLLEERREY
ncbi:hypothetical protein VBD025_03925 [Virgibacillus flavescens]|uniref:hypothetical protein n=1 Tax=Virgibacillus flavescens TaxID=1611422 RepID=UPI003D33B800